MSELRHWTSEDATEAEARLLQAARNARPSAVSRARMAGSLGLGVGAPLSGVGTAKASSALAQVLARKGLLLAIAGGVAGGGAWLASTTGRPSAASPAMIAPSAAATAPVEASTPKAQASKESTPPVPVAPPAPVATSPVASGPSSHVGPSAASSSSWEDELRLLEAAQARLDQNEPGEALARIARYERAYPRGQLHVEAEVIRIEALALQGRRDEARRAANAFLRSFPSAVQVPRVRSVLGQIDRTP